MHFSLVKNPEISANDFNRDLDVISVDLKKDKLPRHRRPLYSHNNNTFHEIRCQSSRCMSSFFPDAITSWNNVITHFDNIPSINILKDHLVSLIRPKKKNIFGIHDPLGLPYLTCKME